jgi:hypothetical protein
MSTHFPDPAAAACPQGAVGLVPEPSAPQRRAGTRETGADGEPPAPKPDDKNRGTTPPDPDNPPKPTNPVGPIPGVGIHLAGIPASKMRDVMRVAVLPLSQASTDVTIELNIHADGGLTGIPRETLNLVVLEGLRQLGFSNVDVNIEEN